MNSSKVLLGRLINAANLMNCNVADNDKVKYKNNEKLFNYTAEIATDMGLNVKITWLKDGQISGIQCGREVEQAVIYENV